MGHRGGMEEEVVERGTEARHDGLVAACEPAPFLTLLSRLPEPPSAFEEKKASVPPSSSSPSASSPSSSVVKL
ncbi:hypothetical protein E2562_011634 [Oryza meyeriana var. granulata]|uniref:Uncharacterized protein n=1 Tax=Oryza meyeriana var. granulata TaxID=110450 RepID=A0A6G1DVD3_9ORYZ|nr:hypothetical protein E2562_011634 [Oryza meyeriana var. granulata]